MNQFRLLVYRRFLPLFLTQFLGAFNDNVYKNALVILITFRFVSEVDDARLWVIMAGGIFILPFFLFSAIAGQLADKYEKSLLIQRIKIAEILIMLMGAFGFYIGNVEFLMLVLFLMGAQSTFFGPLKYSILPQELSADELVGGNGLIQTGTFLAILTGTIMGGFLVSGEVTTPYQLIVIILVVSVAGWLISRFIPVVKISDQATVVRWNIFSETYKLVKSIRIESAITITIICISWFWFVGAAVLSLIPSLGKDITGGNEMVVTIMLTAFSLGIGTGSLLCERLVRLFKSIQVVIAGAFLISLFTLDMLLFENNMSSNMPLETWIQSHGQIRILIDLFGIAFAGGLYIVPLYAELQIKSPHKLRARMIAALNVMNALFMVMSAIITSILLGTGLTLLQVFAFIGVINSGMVIYLLYNRRLLL